MLPQINATTWHANRKLDIVPRHFIRSSVEYDTNMVEWISEKLQGRYAVSYLDGYLTLWFEDPKEAVLCDLIWSK